MNDIRRLILNKMDLNLVSSQPPKCALRLPASFLQFIFHLPAYEPYDLGLLSLCETVV